MAQPTIGHVFMSYSRKDEKIMRRIAAFLRKQGINIWIDNEGLKPGTPVWETEVEKAIISANAVIVILTPESKSSIWVRREINYAEQYGKRIFSVLAQGDEKSSMTMRLGTSQYVDIRQNEDAGISFLQNEISKYLGELERLEKKGGNRTADQGLAQAEAVRKIKQKNEIERIAKTNFKTDRAVPQKIYPVPQEAKYEQDRQKAARTVLHEEYETPFWRRLKFSWEGLATTVRVFAGTSLFFDFALVAFGFSLIQTPPGNDVPFYLTAIQFIVAVAIGFYIGFVETKPFPSYEQFKDTSKDSIWLQVASHAWGFVGFIFWGFITLMSIFIFAMRVVDMESQLALYIVLGGFLLGIAVGIERWDAWKNGARGLLADSFNKQ